MASPFYLGSGHARERRLCARTGQSHDRITARPAFTQKRARLPAEEISLSKSFPTNASRYLYFPQHETFVLAVYWYAAADLEKGSRL
jgi:hypothetical protein